MGLGKTVQTLARIVEGPATTAEKKAGYTGGTLSVTQKSHGGPANGVQYCGATRSHGAMGFRSTDEDPAGSTEDNHPPRALPNEMWGNISFRLREESLLKRLAAGKILEQFDVVITTFQTLASEHGAYETASKTDSSDSDAGEKETRQRKPKGRSPKSSHALFSVKWLRIVIGESGRLARIRLNQHRRGSERQESSNQSCKSVSQLEGKVPLVSDWVSLWKTSQIWLANTSLQDAHPSGWTGHNDQAAADPHRTTWRSSSPCSSFLGQNHSMTGTSFAIEFPLSSKRGELSSL